MTVSLDKEYGLYIDGRWVPASDGGKFPVYDPANGEKLTECAEATKEDVDAAVTAAWKAFPAWKAVDPSVRSKILLDIADAIEANAERLVEGFDLRCPGIMTAAGSLSGGNIQKVILARELDRKPKFLVAVYPTRGLDMGAVEFIHQRLLEIRESGIGILLISEELEEIMNLSDRIAVIYKNTIFRVDSDFFA